MEYMIGSAKLFYKPTRALYIAQAYYTEYSYVLIVYVALVSH